MTTKNGQSLDTLRKTITKDVILNRRSCRSFLDKNIDRQELLELIEAGIYAPSGSNSQNQRFLLIDDEQEIKRIGSIRWVWPYKSNVSQGKLQDKHPSGIIGKASALIFVFADAALNDQRDNGEYYIWESLEIQNCAASIQNILLLSTAKGIGSCWISCSENMTFSRLISYSRWSSIFSDYEIPEHFKIQGLIILGYPRHSTQKGFPKGENVHGVIQSGTQRKNIEEYLVAHKVKNEIKKSVGKYDLIKLKTYTLAIKFFLFLVKQLSRKVYKIDKKYIANLP
jgi:nitroreductase